MLVSDPPAALLHALYHSKQVLRVPLEDRVSQACPAHLAPLVPLAPMVPQVWSTLLVVEHHSNHSYSLPDHETSQKSTCAHFVLAAT